MTLWSRGGLCESSGLNSKVHHGYLQYLRKHRPSALTGFGRSCAKSKHPPNLAVQVSVTDRSAPPQPVFECLYIFANFSCSGPGISISFNCPPSPSCTPEAILFGGERSKPNFKRRFIQLYITNAHVHGRDRSTFSHTVELQLNNL